MHWAPRFEHLLWYNRSSLPPEIMESRTPIETRCSCGVSVPWLDFKWSLCFLIHVLGKPLYPTHTRHLPHVLTGKGDTRVLLVLNPVSWHVFTFLSLMLVFALECERPHCTSQQLQTWCAVRNHWIWLLSSIAWGVTAWGLVLACCPQWDHDLCTLFSLRSQGGILQ